MLDRTAYLQRINYTGEMTPDLATLGRLQHAHLLTVPFENLDIGLGCPIVLDEAALVRKIVAARRGGFCYEANGAFAALLRALGFRVTLLSAGVAHKDGGFGPAFDHLTLLVQLNEPWLVDVGFGETFRSPLRLQDGLVQMQPMGRYRLDHADGQWVLWQYEEAGWQPQYRFDLDAHDLADFSAMCHYHQTSPDSHFTRQRICTLATPDGRITLSDMRLIVTAGGTRQERLLADDAEYHAALRRYFGIVLESPSP
jgi:N-hydroxyarylamine O-acetyltransferase